MAPQKICVVTSGHLTTCPRIVKAARAFSGAGYDVRVVSATLMNHFREMDKALVARERWEWDPIEWAADREWLTYTRTRVRHNVARRATAVIGNGRAPFAVAAAAFHRLHCEVRDRAASRPADLYYGGGGGTTAAVAAAAAQNGARFGVDLEDFHSGESGQGEGRRALVERIERAVLTRADLLTAGSPAIADAYRRKYNVTITPVCNTFPLPMERPSPAAESGNGLRLYWFSQTIGPGRGLETVVDAIGLGGIPSELHLRGACDDSFVGLLQKRIARSAPTLRLITHGVEPQERMVDLCRPYDVGLAAEPASSINNALSLSNKALTYPLAGLALALTNTPGHRPLIDDVRHHAVVYGPDDAAALARGLRAWHDDRAALRCAMAASWDAAVNRWHWEDHDREALLAATRSALG